VSYYTQVSVTEDGTTDIGYYPVHEWAKTYSQYRVDVAVKLGTKVKVTMRTVPATAVPKSVRR
jgi:hypothetical protein